MRLIMVVAILICVFGKGVAEADVNSNSAPLLIQEQNGTNAGRYRVLDFSNGTTTNNNDGSISVTTGGGSSGLTIGTTPIASGTNTYLEYNNNGVLGEIPQSTFLTSAVTTLASLTSANGSTIPASDTLVGRVTIDTLTNKKITKRVDSAQSGVTTITPVSSSYDEVYATDTAAAGTLTIAADNATGQTEGQSLLLKILCTNAQTLSWTTGAKGYYGGSVPLSASTTGGGKVDYFSFIWDAINGVWRCTGNAPGF